MKKIKYKNWQKHFCKNLKKEMDKQGWSQRTLGNAIGVSSSNISFYCNGIFFPSMPVLTKLCEVLGITIDELLGVKNDKKG